MGNDRRRPDDAPATYWLGGRQAVRAALSSHRVISLALLADGHGLGPLAAIAARDGLAVETLTRDELVRRAGPESQGCAALVRRLRPAPLDRILHGPDRRESLVVALDHIQDPQNLGAIARTAECAGASGLVLPSRRAARVTPAAERAAAGAFDFLPFAEVPNLPQALVRCKDEGYWVFGLSADGQAVPAREVLGPRSVVVVGAEGQGLSALVRQRCDQVLRLPLLGRTESLNASVAAGIVLYGWSERYQAH